MKGSWLRDSEFMSSDAAETTVETSVVKLETKVESIDVVGGAPLWEAFAISFAHLIASSLCSFVQSLRFLNAVAPWRKVSALFLLRGVCICSFKLSELVIRKLRWK